MNEDDLVEVMCKIAKPWDDIHVSPADVNMDAVRVTVGKCRFDVSGLELMQCASESDLKDMLHRKMNGAGYE